jgi:hypothetical protein
MQQAQISKTSGNAEESSEEDEDSEEESEEEPSKTPKKNVNLPTTHLMCSHVFMFWLNDIA